MPSTDYEALRAEKIKHLEKLWTEATGKPLSAFDAAIMKKFQLAGGRDNLTFASMEEVENGLLKLINKMETK